MLRRPRQPRRRVGPARAAHSSRVDAVGHDVDLVRRQLERVETSSSRMNSEQQITRAGLVGEPPLDAVDRRRLARARGAHRRGPAPWRGWWPPAGRPHEVCSVSPAQATSQSWAWTTSGRQPPRRAASATRWWLAPAMRATKWSSGSQGRSVRARRTRTPSTTESSGASGWCSVRTTTSWPARARALARPSAWAEMPPTTSGGYSHESMAMRTAGQRRREPRPALRLRPGPTRPLGPADPRRRAGA